MDGQQQLNRLLRKDRPRSVQPKSIEPDGTNARKSDIYEPIMNEFIRLKKINLNSHFVDVWTRWNESIPRGAGAHIKRAWSVDTLSLSNILGHKHRPSHIIR